jgi:caffeoyl-CoA O-methyltransferase
MNFLTPGIQDYLNNITPERDKVLQDMEAYAQEKNFPIIGPLVGRVLYSYAKAIQARRVLELGSGYGYSAYWFAKAMGPEGRVICTEGDEENALRAKEYFRRGKIADRIDFRVGNALQIMDSIEGEFDIILNDIDKRDYPKVVRKAVPRLRTGGLLISDNVLWSSRILEATHDADTAGIATYNRMVYSSRNLFTIVIPIRDGVAVSVKQ